MRASGRGNLVWGIHFLSPAKLCQPNRWQQLFFPFIPFQAIWEEGKNLTFWQVSMPNSKHPLLDTVILNIGFGSSLSAHSVKEVLQGDYVPVMLF